MKKNLQEKLIQQIGKIFFPIDNPWLVLAMTLVSFQTIQAQSNVTPSFDLGTEITMTAVPEAKKDIGHLLKVSDTDTGQQLTWTIVSAPGRGKLSGLPTSLNSGLMGIIPATEISYEPLSGQSGKDSFVIRISDGITTSHLFIDVNIVSSELPSPVDPSTPLDPAGNPDEQNNMGGRNIASVQSLTGWDVPFTTLYAELKLPIEALVTYENQTKEVLPISWYQSNFNGNVSGAYLLIADLLVTPGATNTHYIKAQITITVLPNHTPSALLLSDSILNMSGQMDPDMITATTLSNFLITEDEDDSVHTYQLVEGPGDSDNCKFGVLGGVLTFTPSEDTKDQTDFSIRVKSTDSNHNSIEKAFQLHIAKENINTLTVPNTFSPNGDGINDVWTIPELKDHTSVDVTVYDRSGILMYHSTNPAQGWDGRNTNGKIIAGIYFYIIKVGDMGVSKQGVLIVLTN